MELNTLRYEVEDHVAVIRFNRPRQLNAMNLEMLAELTRVFDLAAGDDAVRAILLTGEGRAFCAGADLQAAGNALPLDAQGRVDLGQPLEQFYNPLVLKMRALPKPVIAAVNGFAAGAGCSFALMADLTVAARSAKFLQAFVNLGLLPDAGSTWLLPRTLGGQRANGFAMLGEPIDAEQALAWGLVWQVVDDEQLMPAALTVAKRLAAGPTLALARIKSALQAAQLQDLGAQLQLERDSQRELGRTQDFIEGTSAFLQKRKAQFKGR